MHAARPGVRVGRDLGGGHDGQEPARLQEAHRLHRLLPHPLAADRVVARPVRIVEAHPDLERVRRARGQRGQRVGLLRTDEGAVGEDGGRSGLERALEQGQDLAVQERLASREVDLLHAQRLRLADGPPDRLAVERLEPRRPRPARVDAVPALEVAPGAGDLHPERGEPEERGPRGRGHRSRGLVQHDPVEPRSHPAQHARMATEDVTAASNQPTNTPSE